MQICEASEDWIDVPSDEAGRGAGVMVQGKDFKGRQFTAEVILWAVRWYLMFPISYGDLELMLQDRSVEVDHTRLCCTDRGSGRIDPNPVWGQVMRT